jgi:hypothetical protein
MPPQMKQIDPQCCKLGCCLGYGCNCLWHGSVCCVPSTVKQFSQIVSSGGMGMMAEGGQR